MNGMWMALAGQVYSQDLDYWEIKFNCGTLANPDWKTNGFMRGYFTDGGFYPVPDLRLPD